MEADDTIPGRAASTSDSVPGSSSAGESSASGKKRPHIINLSNDDDEEIRQSTKVVDDNDIIPNKKPRVAVVIK